MTQGSGRARRARRVTRALLARMPLPALDADDDKNARGRVLVVAGSVQVPGAVLLAGVASLRAGAGKLQLATVQPSALALGLAVPEALVIGLPASRGGEIVGAASAALLREAASSVDAIVIGPGMTADRAIHALLSGIIGRLAAQTTLVLDAGAIVALQHDERLLIPHRGQVILTPHAGEMASLLGIDKQEIDDDPGEAAIEAATTFGAVVALKGPTSWIADPDGTLYRYDGGNVGLATSGSGDTLAGVVGGLAARGADPIVAALWGVWAHGSAGQALAKRMATVGFLARELLAEIPRFVGRA
jgi:ADP-dependent NAD(P)H-hydrate dehydratase